ncbi:MAG: hypothetical protein ACO20I_07815 [bacterium]
MRKIVQISTNHQSGRQECLSVFALCDDGTLWWTSEYQHGDSVGLPAQKPDDWYLVANVPQDSIEVDDLISQQGY